jgi:hypothetical protein
MVEVVGPPADGLNAAIYKFEGKDFEAKMSVAAMLPGGIAATTAKYAKGLKLGDKLVDGAKILTKNADEVAEGAVKAEKALDGAAGTGRIRNFTKEELATKPKNSPNPEKWQKKGGKITIEEDDTWVYHHRNGNVVRYSDGYPDFKSAGLVEQEVNVGGFKDYNTDFKKADELAPNGPRDAEKNTWHHHQDGKTMQEVNKEIHKDYTHRGGMSLKNRKK